MSEKSRVMADAWQAGDTEAVLFLDADLIVTGNLLYILNGLDGQVLLSPNYYPTGHERYIRMHGFYNSGLVMSRTCHFHEWWQSALIEQPEAWADQAVLNDVTDHFAVGAIPAIANIGFWRSRGRFIYDPIPSDAVVLHAHMFQPLRTLRDWLDKSFALHCVEFLLRSPIQQHGEIANEILTNDDAGWFRASLRLR